MIKSLSLDFVQSCLLQEERRLLERNDVKPGVNAALVNKQAVGSGVVCGHCGKSNRTEPRCWLKCPHLKLRKVRCKDAGLAAKARNIGDESDSDSDGVICASCVKHRTPQLHSQAEPSGLWTSMLLFTFVMTVTVGIKSDHLSSPIKASACG